MNRSEEIEALERESERWTFTNPERYREITNQMLALCRGASPAAQGRAYRAHGNALRLAGRLAEAQKAVQRALRCWRRAGDEIEWARTQNTLIPILAQLGENRRALAASRAGLAVFLRLNQDLPAARLLNNTGGIYLFTGKPREALQCYERAKDLAMRAGDPALGARADLTGAMALQALGRHREALKRCAVAIRPLSETGQRLNVARIFVVAATSLFQLGRFGKALRRFAKARRLFEQESADRELAECELHICACYLELNRFGPALGRIEGFLEQQGRAWFEVALASFYRGVALARTGRHEEARTSLAKAGRLFRRHGDSQGVARAGLEEAELLLRLGEGVKAANIASRLQRDGRLTSPVEQARAALVQADAFMLAGNLPRAEVGARQAEEIARRTHTPGMTFRALHLLGRIAVQRHQFDAASPYLTRAVRLAEQMRATVQLPFRQTFLVDKAAAYADLIWLYLETGEVRKAHRLTEQAKSRALADQLAATPPPLTGRSDQAQEPLLRELEAVRQEYQQVTLPTTLATSGVRALPVVETARRRWLEQRLGILWDEWELRQVGAVAMVESSAKDRSHRLKRGEAIVEYMVVRERLIAFVTDQRGLSGWSDLGSIEVIMRTLELLQLNLETSLDVRHPGAIAGLTRNANSLLGELYRRLWAPLPLLAHQDWVLVVPHGPLHQIPFGALYDGAQYLVERLELTMAPSRTVWRRCQDRAQQLRSTTDLVLAHNPHGELPFVEFEAMAVAQYLGVPAYVGDQATLTRVVGSGPCRVLHLAVHGQFRTDNPEFSALLLADGTLTAADVAGRRLQAELVILSACETGLSRVSSDEELTGLITAFLMAGSASVLASLWRVDDESTASLMLRLYQGLLSGRGKADSLRDAQIDMIRKRLHPVYWAAFAVIGDGGPLRNHPDEGGNGLWHQ